MDLIYFILAAYGMTFIIIHGKIFEDIRPQKDYSKKWNTLWHCPLCMGFWVGVVLMLLSVLGCLSAGTSYLMSVLVDDFGLRLSSRPGGDNVGD